MNRSEVAGGAILRQRAPDDDLEIGLLLGPVAHISAVKTNDDASLRKRQLLPIGGAPFDKAAALLAEFSLRALGDANPVRADGGGVEPPQTLLGPRPARNPPRSPPRSLVELCLA